jgi:hypothetical protein
MEQLAFSPASLLPTISADKNNSGAEFTVVSNVTGKDFTFKISRSEWNGKFYTHVKVEMGYLNFNYLGSYFMGKIRRKRQVVSTPSAIAIAWVLDKVEKQNFDLLEKSVTLLHLGNCVRCGRALTDHNSIKAGLGPVCRSY